MDWCTVDFYENQIKATSERAVCIICPHSSRYDGYSFWVPSAFVRQGRNAAMMSLFFPSDFVFHLKKTGNGRYNRHRVIAEINLQGREIYDAFGEPAEQLNPYETHKPQELAAVDVTADESLIDDG